jgi:hypothetical protein
MFTHDLEIEPFRKTSKTIRGIMHKMFHPAGLFSGFVLVLPRDHGLWRQELNSCLQVNCNQRVSKNSDGRSHHRAAWKYQHFDGFDSSSTPGCFAAQGNLTTTIWSVSDTTNINISNVHDATYGVASCRLRQPVPPP